MPDGTILILDDEPKLAEAVARSLERSGYRTEVVREPEAALASLKGARYDVLVTDLRMPGLDGLEVLTRAKAIDPSIEVILMTAYATVDTAREAMKRGAVDYLVKPFSAEDDLKPILARLLDGGARKPAAPAPTRVVAPSPEVAHAPSRGSARTARCASAAMAEIYRKVEKVARGTTTVLIRGESGTGKEVIADLVHSSSPRAGRAYVKINCGALPETLLESELFGHVRGSFTGATGDREGLFKAADQGTIFLDEIGEVSPALQVRLLRVLQNGEVTPVGDNRPLRVDVRVIAATNRPLEAMVKDGRFREDLYFRLNVVPLTIPSLRDRGEDLELLLEFFSRKFSGGRAVAFSAQAMEAIRAYRWPGNIRELENAVEHALVLGDGERILLEDLPAALQDGAQPGGGGAAVASAVGGATLEEIEKKCLLAALEKTRGNRTRASRLLGITRRTLGYRLRKYGLEDEADRLGGGGGEGEGE